MDGNNRRTYSRQKKTVAEVENEPVRKRRRLDMSITTSKEQHEQEHDEDHTAESAICSSSPQRNSSMVFSDPPTGYSSPPSSPPQIETFLPPKATQCSSVSKPTSTSPASVSPLRESTGNGRRHPIPRKKRLVQMQIDLGGKISKTCRSCGMEYIPSNAEDAALHKEFHSMNVGGVELAKPFLQHVAANAVWTGDNGDCIAVIGRKDTALAHKQAKKVLQVANSELSAVEMRDEDLWGRVGRGHGTQVAKTSTTSADSLGEADSPKVFLYIKGKKAVGLCLAERIAESRKVSRSAADRPSKHKTLAAHDSSSISTGEETFPAVIGIQRIWTSCSHRRKGIGSHLLETVVCRFLFGLRVPKDMVAFSQPTESGGKLARQWFGKDDGWLVYSER